MDFPQNVTFPPNVFRNFNLTFCFCVSGHAQPTQSTVFATIWWCRISNTELVSLSEQKFWHNIEQECRSVYITVKFILSIQLVFYKKCNIYRKLTNRNIAAWIDKLLLLANVGGCKRCRKSIANYAHNQEFMIIMGEQNLNHFQLSLINETWGRCSNFSDILWDHTNLICILHVIQPAIKCLFYLSNERLLLNEVNQEYLGAMKAIYFQMHVVKFIGLR